MTGCNPYWAVTSCYRSRSDLSLSLPSLWDMGICLIAVCNAVASSRPPLDCPPPLCDVIVLEWEKPGDGGLGDGGGNSDGLGEGHSPDFAAGEMNPRGRWLPQSCQ